MDAHSAPALVESPVMTGEWREAFYGTTKDYKDVTAISDNNVCQCVCVCLCVFGRGEVSSILQPVIKLTTNTNVTYIIKCKRHIAIPR